MTSTSAAKVSWKLQTFFLIFDAIDWISWYVLEVLLAAAGFSFAAKNNVPMILWYGLALTRSSGRPQALSVWQEERPWNFMTCESLNVGQSTWTYHRHLMDHGQSTWTYHQHGLTTLNNDEWHCISCRISLGIKISLHERQPNQRCWDFERF